MKHLKKFNFALFESIKDKNTVKAEIEDYFLNLIDKGENEIDFSEDNYVYKGTTNELSFKETPWASCKFTQNKNVHNEIYLTDKQLNKLNQLQKGFYPCYEFKLSINKSMPMQSLLKNIERLENDDDYFVFIVRITIAQKMYSDFELQEFTELAFLIAELGGRADKVEDLPKVFRDDNEDYDEEEDELEEEYEVEEEDEEDEDEEEDEEDEGN